MFPNGCGSEHRSETSRLEVKRKDPELQSLRADGNVMQAMCMPRFAGPTFPRGVKMHGLLDRDIPRLHPVNIRLGQLD